MMTLIWVNGPSQGGSICPASGKSKSSFGTTDVSCWSVVDRDVSNSRILE